MNNMGMVAEGFEEQAAERLAFSHSLAKGSAIEREDVVAASISQNRPGKAVGLQRVFGGSR
jgi:hypothetical protein